MQLKLILLAIAASVVVSAKALPQLDDTTAALLGIDDFEDADDGDFDEGDLVARDLKAPGAPILFIPTEALPKHKHHKHHKHHRGGRKHHHKHHGGKKHKQVKHHRKGHKKHHRKQHHDGHEPAFAYPTMPGTHGRPILPRDAKKHHHEASYPTDPWNEGLPILP